MKFSEQLAVLLVCGLPVVAAAATDDGSVSSNNPYESIAVRNVFNLNPIVQGPPEEPQASTKITLNGIMSILGKEQSYILSEGQMQDDITVVKIDEKTSTVTFDNHGITQDLTLAKATPTGPAGPVFGSPPPNSIRRFDTRGPGRFGFNNFRNRNNNENANAGENNNTGDNPMNLRNIPTRTYQPPQSSMTPEEQVIMIEAQRQYYQQQGNPMAKLLPPTSMTPHSGSGTPSAPGAP